MQIDKTLVTSPISIKRVLRILFFVFCFALVFSVFASLFHISENDFSLAYYPAIRAMFGGHSPYTAAVYNPPWIFLLLSPLALFPPEIGKEIASLLNFIGFSFVAYKMGAKPLGLAAFVLSPQVLYAISYGNIDWLICLGFLMPPWLGLFLVLAKPQLGIAVAVYWLFEAWRKGGIKQAVKTFTPVTVAFLLSFLLYGLWPLTGAKITGVYWNTSLWPASIPIGLVLLVSAIRARNFNRSIIASPFLSPYLTGHSWLIPVVGLLSDQTLTVAAVAGLWLLKVITG